MQSSDLHRGGYQDHHERRLGMRRLLRGTDIRQIDRAKDASNQYVGEPWQTSLLYALNSLFGLWRIECGEEDMGYEGCVRAIGQGGWCRVLVEILLARWLRRRDDLAEQKRLPPE